MSWIATQLPFVRHLLIPPWVLLDTVQKNFWDIAVTVLLLVRPLKLACY
jgi:hypothetical protein